ncbi:ABC-type nitrate/sulfonate/bicarbonate transport systems, periplasmic components [Rhodovastum atsumiense]|uniref:Twin-arginine translocation signal domain-containing protein n=1 Tax=Rhodovastum atsumiense TaxID=504468 RepID=A0A5M6IK79_9PROT|nr:ABC transporter substrate-binding protein [Rhodovastum atsumiense]KAA5608666.1 twin-arginine translocation signal domain-containing protein [Rhodovastum atsumiense]CAH2598810.1 ABC-type nitrate/sulfonate/bicarbonate transport systems, periplasmic components [Rhodovastum atsumiense]
MNRPPFPSKSLSRRRVLGTAALAGAAVPLGLPVMRALASPVQPAIDPTSICHAGGVWQAAAPGPLAAPAIGSGRKKLTVSWNQNALCVSFVPVAVHGGFFERHGLDIDLVNFGGSTDQLLEGVATGKSDVAEGMVLRWLKPLEGGFDVKLVAGLHGGCSYLVASRAAGIVDFQTLRGKTIGVSDFASPDKNLYSIVLRRKGIDPDRDVEWKQFPTDMMPVAVQKGEIQAYVAGDPLVYLQVENSQGKLFRLASNATGDFAERTCCVLGLRGSLIRQDPEAARAVTLALLEACHDVHQNPDRAVEYFSRYTPPSVPTKALSEMLKSYPFGDQPVGSDFRRQIVLYAQELKQAGVLKPGTDPERYAQRITANVV